MNIKMNFLKIGVIQLDVQVNNYDGNIERAMRMLDICADKGCQLVCLPEAFSTSIDLRGIEQISEEIPGKTSQILCRKAEERKIYIIAGIIEKEENIYSSSLLINSKGEIVDVYRRVHIYQLERRFLSPGNFLKVNETPIGRIGMIIGYDINFPESCRYLFRKRAEIIVCPAHIPHPFASTTVHLAIARAIENGCYFILVSSVGENIFARIKYMGNSLIARSPVALDPYGPEYIKEDELIAKADSNETIIYGKFSLRRLRREQRENPNYKDMVMVSCFEYGNIKEVQR